MDMEGYYGVGSYSKLPPCPLHKTVSCEEDLQKTSENKIDEISQPLS
jgi:hypothetical protein